MDAAACQAQGEVMGSGMVEKAVALVVSRRCKRRGMRGYPTPSGDGVGAPMSWTRNGVEAMVTLRTSVLNAAWGSPQEFLVLPGSG